MQRCEFDSCAIIYTKIVCLLLLALFVGVYEKKMLCCRNKSAAKTTDINGMYKGHFEEWNVKECVYRSAEWEELEGAKKKKLREAESVHDEQDSSFYAIPFSPFLYRYSQVKWLFQLDGRVFNWGGEAKSERGRIDVMLVGYEEHYTYNRFIYELMADMLVKYVSKLFAYSQRWAVHWMLLYRVDDGDGIGDIFTTITLSIIESIYWYLVRKNHMASSIRFDDEM